MAKDGVSIGSSLTHDAPAEMPTWCLGVWCAGCDAARFLWPKEGPRHLPKERQRNGQHVVGRMTLPNEIEGGGSSSQELGYQLLGGHAVTGTFLSEKWGWLDRHLLVVQ